jgi:hypothetical protein
MKSLKVVMVLLVALAVIVPAVSAQAAWKTCWVNNVGQNATAKYMYITDTATTVAFTNQPCNIFIGSDAQNTAMFSAALTAMASGMKVYVNYTAPVPPSVVGTITAGGLIDTP